MEAVSAPSSTLPASVPEKCSAPGSSFHCFQARSVHEDWKRDFSNVVKTTVFIKDMNEFAQINEVYAEYFGENKPARACVEVARLPKDVKVEIELIAVL